MAEPTDEDNPHPGSLTPPQAAKTLMVLGLLQSGPRHGYELHRIMVAHGSLYADFKKPTLYHLLHRLALHGTVQVRSEGGTRGRRGERLVFALTAQGEEIFRQLLRAALSSYDAVQTSFEVAAAFLPWIPPKEAQSLLKQRRGVVRNRRAEVLAEMESMARLPPSQRVHARFLAADHALSLMNAEVAWMDRVLRQLTAAGSSRAWAGRAVAGLRRAVGE